MNGKKQAVTKTEDAASELKQVARAISKLPRNSLIHLIDEAAGVGCWDEADKDRLREEVSRLFAGGKIAARDILDMV
jgi:hypothetical protein